MKGIDLIMKNLKEELRFGKRGITLISLVVTIIVLLILAGITIATLTGDNGILQRASEAKQKTEQAQKDEESEINKATDIIEMYSEGINTATTVANAIVQNKRFVENTKIIDDLGNEVMIPQGFKVASDSATKVEDGIVIEDKNENQFVWIPVSTTEKPVIYISSGDKTIKYTRTDFKGDDITTDYTEDMPIDEINSINENGGYLYRSF